jgi:hypothetical protein
MSTTGFTRWVPWLNRAQLAELDMPGVYALAITDRDISGRVFSWRAEIVYVGMTNAQNGLRGRLMQFDATVAGRRVSHGGADRVRYKHRNVDRLAKRLYVSVNRVQCNVESNLPRDLLSMGDVARLEYVCLAAYARKFGRLPEFNDKATARKYSKTVGRRA